MVLNIVMAMAPCAQLSPRCWSTPPDFVFQAVWQTCRAAFALEIFADISSASYGCSPETFTIPLSFWPMMRLCEPTADSANAMVSEDSSVQLCRPYDACQVNSPVLGMLMDAWFVPHGAVPICDQYIVVPTEA